MKIGLFGGTFDPVHNMHVAIAEMSIAQFGLDEIWFLADLSPRRKNNVTDYRHRLNMIKLACKNNPRHITDRLDIQKNGYTHDDQSFKKIINQHPDDEFYIICGVDTIKHLDKWQNPELFLQNACFIVVPRPDSEIAELDRLTDLFMQNGHEFKYKILKTTTSHVSSSKIRLATKKHANDLNKSVLDYINENKLY